MKTQIKSQAKSEVDELLSSCVVSPLEEHIQNALHKSEEALSDTVGEKTRSAEKHLSVQIEKLSTLLEKKTGELSENLDTDIPEAIEDIGKAVQDDISALGGAVDKRLTALERSLSDAKQDLTDVSQQHTGTILEELTSISQSIDQSIKASAEAAGRDMEKLNTQLAAHKTQIGKQIDGGFSQSAQATGKKLEEITQEMNSSFSGLFRDMEQIRVELSQQIDDKLSEPWQAILRKLEQFKSTVDGNLIETGNKMDSLAETLERSQTCVANCQGEMKTGLEQYKSEAEKRTEKRYKTLLAVSLLLGSANFLGIIVLALICFL